MRVLVITLMLLAGTGCANMDDPSCDRGCRLRADYFDCTYEGGTWDGRHCNTVDIKEGVN